MHAPALLLPGQLRVALAGPEERRTIGAGAYTVHRRGQPSERRMLHDADDVLTVLHEAFGITVPAHPRLREAITAWLRGAA